MKTINTKKLDELITKNTEARLGDGRLGHAEVIVNQNGKRVLHKLFGTDGVNGPALSSDRIYRVASMTKPFTAACVLQCAEKGLIDLQTPVADYLPAFSHMTVAHIESKDGKNVIVQDGDARVPILVYHLLTHTSGIGCLSLNPSLRLSLGSPEKTADYYAKAPLSFRPYTAQCYSPTAAFDVAARIIEVVTGESFGPYVQEHICKPLGLTDTTFEPTPEQYDRMVTMHQRAADGSSIDLPRKKGGSVFFGAKASAWAAGAGLASTAEDYSKFAEMLLHLGVGANGERILTEQSVKTMQTPHVPESLMNCDERWGLGVRVITRPSYAHKLPVGAWGWSGAYGTHFWVDPVNQITAVYMKNSGYDGGAGAQTANEFEEAVMDSLGL